MYFVDVDRLQTVGIWTLMDVLCIADVDKLDAIGV